jgi:hypothetical protein
MIPKKFLFVLEAGGCLQKCRCLLPGGPLIGRGGGLVEQFEAGLGKPGFFFKPSPVGFFGFYWVLLFVFWGGFIGFFKFCVCDMTFCCILHLNVLLDM